MCAIIGNIASNRDRVSAMQISRHIQKGQKRLMAWLEIT